MERVCNLDKCAGCYACANICPKKCISMKYNEQGILLPSIDQEKCVDCKACQKVCPVNQPVEKRKATKAFAAWHLDETTRRKSASGGAAMAFYETMLEKNGICFGTRFDKNLDLVIQSATSREEVHTFKGSKYVQAMVGDSFSKAKEYLDEGKEVLYIGTPCQIAGLLKYLRKDYDNLITIDLVCHGVPSMAYLKDHVETLKMQLDQNIDNISFRNGYLYELALYSNQEKIYAKERFLDSYLVGFTNGLFMRPNCYTCTYACDERVSDITIGDFWGLGNEAPCDFELGEGISLIIPNTEKGSAFVELASDKLSIHERPVSEAIHGNTQLMHPSEQNVNHESFLKMYQEKGFDEAAWEYTKTEIGEYKKKLKKKFLLRCIKKMKKILK